MTRLLWGWFFFRLILTVGGGGNLLDNVVN